MAEKLQPTINILTARNSLQRVIKEQPTNIDHVLNRLRIINSPVQIDIYVRLEIERGKENSIDYALCLQPKEEEVSKYRKPIEELITDQDCPDIDDMSHTKNYQELVAAKTIIGGTVDRLWGDAHIHTADKWFNLKMDDTDEHFEEEVFEASTYLRNLGRLHALNFILNKDNDGDMSELIEKNKNNLKAFKIPRHP
jgi:hypothetical protein